MHHASLEDEQYQADLIGLAQTASRTAVLLYDIEAGRTVELAEGRNARLTERAISFLRSAEEASDSLDDYKNNLANLIGSETADVSYYRYYIEAKKLTGYDIETSDKELKTYVATLSRLVAGPSASATECAPVPAQPEVKQLADFFLGLGRMMLGYAYPLPEPES